MIKAKRAKSKGVSFIESVIWMGMTVTLASVISGFLLQSQKLSSVVWTSQEEQASRASNMQYIFEDLRSAKRHSIGSLIVNGDFEMTTTNTYPDYWATSPVISGGAYGEIQLTHASNASDVRYGNQSCKLNVWFGNVHYNYATPITLTPGNAYMISAWIRGTGGALKSYIALANSSGNVLVSTGTTGTNWGQLVARYPASGTYTNGLVPNNKVYLRFGNNGGSGVIFIDNVALTGLHNILQSSGNEVVNTLNLINNTSDPNDDCGIRFIKFENGNSQLYRYRTSTNGATPVIRREYFDTNTAKWVGASPQTIGLGIQRFSLSWIEDISGAALPSNLNETGLLVRIQNRPNLNNKIHEKGNNDSFFIYPVTP